MNSIKWSIIIPANQRIKREHILCCKTWLLILSVNQNKIYGISPPPSFLSFQESIWELSSLMVEFVQKMYFFQQSYDLVLLAYSLHHEKKAGESA